MEREQAGGGGRAICLLAMEGGVGGACLLGGQGTELTGQIITVSTVD